MAIVIVTVVVIGSLLLYLGCLHSTGSVCMFALIHSDSNVVTNIFGNLQNFREIYRIFRKIFRNFHYFRKKTYNPSH